VNESKICVGLVTIKELGMGFKEYAHCTRPAAIMFLNNPGRNWCIDCAIEQIQGLLKERERK